MEIQSTGYITPRKLKRVVVKEEFVALTGDMVKAIILNQFIYWSERVQDFDKFIAEEKTRAEQAGQKIVIEYTNGWIYKSAEELSEETMLKMSASSIRKHLKEIVDQGWLLERTNPIHKWDRTKQYRVNLLKIHDDLLNLGYVLQDYKISFSKTETPFSNSKNASSNIENGVSNLEDQSSEIKNQTARNRKAIPEITTEITYKEDLSINQFEVKQNEMKDGGRDLETSNDSIEPVQELNQPLHVANDEELLTNLAVKTGATKEQICRAIQRTKKLESQGKVKKSFLGLLLSVIETIKTEDIAKNLAEKAEGIEGREQPIDPAVQKRKKLIQSLYMS